MNVQPVVLWTDALIFLMVGAIVLIATRIRKQPHLAEPWQRVARRPMAAASLIVLAVFVAIGLLDSLHYRERLPGGDPAAPQYAVDVLSAFDALVMPLRTRQEKTYSAPLAIRLYSKEFIERDGVRVRDFPRLQYGGAHLADPRAHLADVLRRAVSGAASGLLAVVAALLAAAAWRAHRSRQSLRAYLAAAARGELDWPARTVAVTLVLLCAGGAAVVSLASGYHVLGTDKVGQDVLYISLKSIRTGLVIGTLTTLFTLPLAIGLGIAAGYFRGWVDDAIQYVYTVLNAIPGVLLIAAAVLIVQVAIESHPALFDTAAARADIRLLALCLILGVTSWTGLARLLRGEALKLSALDYVDAARAFGVSHGRIIGRHIFPNVFHLVLISVVMDFSGLVLAEAVLSYVGVGVDPSMYSWGNMINGARLELAREPAVWWQLGAAFLFMFALVLAANLFADSVRDAFDPRRGPR